MPASDRKRLEGLVSISRSTAWSSTPEAINQKMVDTLADVLECDFACIHLMDVSGNYLKRCVTHGNISEHFSNQGILSISTGRTLQMMKTHRPIIMDFLHPHPLDRIPSDPLGFRSAMSVPLIAGCDMLGMFSIVYRTRQRWTKQDVDYLLNIGELLGIAIQHASIARKMVDLEILLERKRLSGELHDQLSQLVSTINLGIETTLLSWEEGDMDGVRNDLERIKGVANEANRALREEMLSLRLPSNESEDLIRQIREYLARFEKQWGIHTTLKVDDDLEPLIISTQMELQFMRILHESLSNVLRHSAASRVDVELKGDCDRLRMQIHDNGHGFSLESVSSERLGLRIMRERAESLGGVLTIESSSKTGTIICVDVPRYD